MKRIKAITVIHIIIILYFLLQFLTRLKQKGYKMKIDNQFNNNKDNDFKRVYLINNDKDNEHYLKEFNNSADARHFIINHLDLSKNWRIL